MAYIAQLLTPVQSITKRIGQLQGSIAGAVRAFALLDEVPDVVERPIARRIVRSAGAVRLEHVSFAYGDGEPVLRDISFDVRPGARVGIAGPTGAGKTTLINLLTRMYDPASGAVLLDGIDLRDYQLEDLRGQFGIVLQEPVLFSTTHRRKHRLREAGSDGCRDRRGGPRGQRARLHRGAADRLRHPGRRTRSSTLGRRAPARLARARLPEGCADSDLRRADQLHRPRHGRAHHAGHGPPDGRPDDVHHRAPPEHPRAMRRQAPVGARTHWCQRPERRNSWSIDRATAAGRRID